MSIPATCCRCAAKTWIIFDADPWCREHFLAEADRRASAVPGELMRGSGGEVALRRA